MAIRSQLLPLATILATTLAAGVASAATVDLSSWTTENYPPVSGFDGANWEVEAGGGSVLQTINGQPTIFYGGFNSFGLETTGKIQVTTGSDDDFVGFVLGFDSGDTTSASANFLLVDWKQASQSYNFLGGTADLTAGSNAPVGLAVSRVTGIPTADELWGHDNQVGNANGGVEELARAITLGSTGWVDNAEYEFSFDFGPSNLVIKVDGVKQFDLSGSFENGSFGFYNFSQDAVKYSAFETDTGTFPSPVPLPAGGLLLLSGLVGFAGLMRRKKRAA
jgi:hypothetical protein